MSSKKNHGGDERFLRVQKDPRFWEMPEKERKIKIDKRFQSMFHDKRFKVKYTVDKRGRPINHTSTEDLKRFYKLSDSEDEEEEEEDVKSKKAAEGKKKKKVKEKLVKADGDVKKGRAAQSRDGEAKTERAERGVRVFEEGETKSTDSTCPAPFICSLETCRNTSLQPEPECSKSNSFVYIYFSLLGYIQSVLCYFYIQCFLPEHKTQNSDFQTLSNTL